MFIKGLLISLLLYILFSLFRAIPQLKKESNAGKAAIPMSHYLGRRVFFSVILLLLVLILLVTGLIEPNRRPY